MVTEVHKATVVHKDTRVQEVLLVPLPIEVRKPTVGHKDIKVQEV
jgi:hypothetical protein